MNNFLQNYEFILNTIKNMGIEQSCIKQKRQPKLSDLSIIAMNLTAEYMSIDSICQ